MPRRGFLHDKLDIKFLILYLLDHAAAPLDLATLTDLAMIDQGVDYFRFAESLSELTASGHVLCQEDRYSITPKGHLDSLACESSLPPSVRDKAARRLTTLNAVLSREAMVRSELLPRPDGGCTLRLILDDDGGNLFTLELLAPSQAQALALERRFRDHPERIYNGILDVLLSEDGEEERNPHD